MAPVDRAICFNIAQPPAGNGRVDAPHLGPDTQVNDETAAFVRSHPERYIGFFSVHPDDPAMFDEADRCRTDLGLKGLKLGLTCQNVDPLGENAFRLFAYAQEHRLPVMLHQGTSPVRVAGIDHTHPRHTDRIAMAVPVHALLGGAVRASSRTKHSVSGLEPARADGIAAWAVAQGFTAMKVKVGIEPAADLARVRAVRETVGPDVLLGVDANGGWTPASAVRLLPAPEELDIAFVEQPVPAGAPRWLAHPGIRPEIIPCDLISRLFYEADIVQEPLPVAGGVVRWIDRPGLGVDLDRDAVSRFRAER